MFMQLLTFKTPIGYNKGKPITECMFALFLTSEISPLHVG